MQFIVECEIATWLRFEISDGVVVIGAVYCCGSTTVSGNSEPCSGVVGIFSLN